MSFGPTRVVDVEELMEIRAHAEDLLHGVKAEPLDNAAREILFLVDAILDEK